MMNAIILPALAALCPVSYILVFFGMILEGEIVLLSSAFLTYHGVFKFAYIIPAVILGVFIGDVLWFRIGTKNCPISRVLKSMADKAVLYLRAEDMLVKRPFFIIFISKFLYGFNHLLIVKAASSGIEFGKFMRVNVLATFLWIALVGGLGYLFGASFYSFKKLMHYAEFAVLAFIILFPFIERLISGLIFKVSGKKSGGVLENRVEN